MPSASHVLSNTSCMAPNDHDKPDLGLIKILTRRKTSDVDPFTLHPSTNINQKLWYTAGEP